MLKEYPINGSHENDWPVGDSIKHCEECWLPYYGEVDQHFCYLCSVKSFERKKHLYRRLAKIRLIVEIVVLTLLAIALLALAPLLVTIVETLSLI